VGRGVDCKDSGVGGRAPCAVFGGRIDGENGGYRGWGLGIKRVKDVAGPTRAVVSQGRGRDPGGGAGGGVLNDLWMGGGGLGGRGGRGEALEAHWKGRCRGVGLGVERIRNGEWGRGLTVGKVVSR